MEKVNYSKLADAFDMWKHLSFEPWSWDGMRGVSRVITLVKGGLMGKIATYYVWDYVVWEYRGMPDMEKVYSEWKPKTDVMSQRFLFVGNDVAPLRKIKSFWLGLRGYLEIYHYKHGGEFHPKIKDIIPPIDFVIGGAK